MNALEHNADIAKGENVMRREMYHRSSRVCLCCGVIRSEGPWPWLIRLSNGLKI